jgi:hypothetical protein
LSEIHYDKKDIDSQKRDRQIVFWLKRGGVAALRRLDRSVLLRALDALAVPPYQRVEDAHLTLKLSGRWLAAAAVAMALLAVTPADVRLRRPSRKATRTPSL